MKSPAFQFYTSDYLGSQRVQMLSLEEEGAYIRLLCYCWQHGSIPSDPEKCARLIGKSSSTTLARVVQAMFIASENDAELIHDRLDEQREKQRVWKEKCSAGGRKSAEIRQESKSSSSNPARVVENYLEVKGSIPTPIPIPIPIPSPTPIPTPKRERRIFTPPTLPEWTAYGLSLSPPFPQDEIDQTFDHYTGNGWRAGKNPMSDWKASLRTCWRNWKKNPRPQFGATPGQRPKNIYQGETVK